MEQPTNIPILLVDDLPENLIALEALLSEMPLELDLVKASSGNEALKLSLKRDFALILLDVQMPGMNGMETAELLRSNSKTRHIPIIFVTAGMTNQVDIFKGYELGAVDYLIKPIESLVLQGKVRIFCELYALRAKLEQHNLILSSKIDEQSKEVSSLSFILTAATDEQRKTQQELQESENRMHSVIESAYEAFICMDDNGQIFEWNQQATTLFGWERAEILNQKFVDLIIPPRNREAHLQGQIGFIAASKDNPFNERFEIKAMHRDGREFPIELSVWKISGTSEQLFGAFIRDITERKKAEIAMLELNEQLESRVAARTRELEQSQQKVIHSERLASLGSLVAGVAHEMNTPIGNCVSLASTLQANAANFARDIAENKVRRSDMEKFLTDMEGGHEILVRNLARAATLVQSFKQVAVDQTSNQRRRFDLKKVLEEDVVTIGPMYKKTPYKMHMLLASDITIDSYPGPLGQIITNFVSNSIMHGFGDRTQGMMLLRTQLLDEDNVEITYEDDGNGIDQKNLNHIFDPFFTTKLGQGGSGLGLSIVHNLVVGVLGGTINVESTPDNGTKFTLVLPTTAPEIKKS
jgi:PAS domain S-box-containing protein